MEKRQWDHGVDQWLEDKVWTKFPKEYQSPHFFFLLGVMTSAIIFGLLMLIF